MTDSLTSPLFEKLYKNLNAEQKKAVDTIEGPVMVIAGPGTGKTSILTLRIANILRKTQATPDAILALTFTESGVHSMRKKLVDIIGTAAYRVNIHTFHSFCNEVIKNNPQEFPRIIGAAHIHDVDQIRIMEEIIENTKLERLKPAMNTFFYLRPILGHIQELKRENISPEAFLELVKKQQKQFAAIDDLYYESGKYAGEMRGKYKNREKKIANNLELATLYKKYQKALEKERFYDYEDMIMETVRVLEGDQDLLLRLQENYQYILADEHQDANNAQNKLLELLSGFFEQPNLFIVGDEKQAIFRFQGASLSNFLYFKKRFPQAFIISLEKNYRSPQGVLDASHSLISKNAVHDASLRIALKASSTEAQKITGPTIVVGSFSRQDYEYLFLAKDIAEKIGMGVPAESIAVLYRDNKDVYLPRLAFERQGIPYVIHSEADLFSDPDIQNVSLLLRTVANYGTEEYLAQLLFIYFLSIHHLDTYKLLQWSHKKRIPLYEIISSKQTLIQAGIQDVEKILELSHKLHTWSIYAKNHGAIEAFEEIVRSSGFIEYALTLPNSVEKLRLYDTFVNVLKNAVERHKEYRLGDFLAYLDTLALHNVSMKSPSLGFVPGKVNLMTAHKSKGLEFDYVYVIGVTDGHWGNKRHPSFFELPIYGEAKADNEDEEGAQSTEDERRLFFVALTRSRKQVYITYARESLLGKSALPSQFISEIHPEYIHILDSENFEKKHQMMHVVESVEPKKFLGITDADYLKNVFIEQGLSVTALNNYLRCPWHYFFSNLIRIPRSEEKQQMYGTAIHEALRDFFNAYKEGKKVTKSMLIDQFMLHLSQKALYAPDHEALAEKGTKALTAFYEHKKDGFKQSVMNEFTVSGVQLPVHVMGKDIQLLLKGQLDRVDFMNPGELSGDVHVVDYKTGRPKTRNEIEGKTKNSDGDYKRQLVFYKLLLELYEKGKYTMVTGEIIFIEPDDRGNTKCEVFAISDEEVKELRSVIQKTAEEIFTLSFWGKKCDDRECEYCQLGEKLLQITAASRSEQPSRSKR